MNVLFFYETTIIPLHGGVQCVTYYLGEELRKNGINVYYLSAIESGESWCSQQYYFPDKINTFSKKNRRYYTKLLMDLQIDIVINQSGITPILYKIIDWSKISKLKVITVLHNSLYGLYGVSNHLKSLSESKGLLMMKKNVNYALITIFKLKYGRYYKKMVLQSDKVVLLSPKFKSEIIDFSQVYDERKYVAIPNPLTVDNNGLTSLPKQNTVLFVGRFAFEKRIDLLLKIWSKVYCKHPTWSLKLVGDGKCKDDMIALSKNLNLERVSFEGYQKPEKYYNRASIFCMTSSFEGFGLVLTEAMFFGVVPIAFKSYPNIVDIIDDGENGILIQPFDIDAYAEQLSILMTDTSKRQRMTEAAKIKSNAFRIEEIAKLWINLFSILTA